MSKRRDQLKAMLAPIVAAPVAPQERHPRPLAGSGSLKAMGLSLQSLSEEAEEARTLRAQLTSGTRVVELDPALVDPSFIRDRLGELQGEDFEAFKARLAQDGQQVPVLVRPHPEKEGRYQSAYGHRRIAALRALGQPVKAIVRDLSDDELIFAQGKENSDRRDLSFIEKALFAARLEARGYARTALMAALSLQKGNLSTMLSIVRALPEELILAIGPAPGIGRPRWERLASLAGCAQDAWRTAAAAPGFSACASDQRFERVMNALEQRPQRPEPQIVRAADGKPLARALRDDRSLRLTIDARQAPQFGDWLVEQLPEIYAAFRRRADA